MLTKDHHQFSNCTIFRTAGLKEKVFWNIGYFYIIQAKKTAKEENLFPAFLLMMVKKLKIQAPAPTSCHFKKKSAAFSKKAKLL